MAEVSMKERIARALAAEEGYAYDPEPYDARAAAVLEAMREPTPAMIEAGLGRDMQLDGLPGIEAIRADCRRQIADIYTAAIDAAKEGA